jgi:shikimate dehydrogenase
MDPVDRYAVMGNPIAHSKSPAIHTAFARQTGQSLEYTAIRVEPGGFPEAVQTFRAQGGRGLNVTVPFKEDAYLLAETRSERAERARAVNTLVLPETGPLHGDNTDGVGLVRDLTANHSVALAGQAILLLGAGGAARGVLGPLLAAGPERVFVANRTASRAVELAGALADLGEVQGGGFDEVEGAFDLIINATAASLAGELPPLADATADGAVCYDLMYAAEPTPFMRWAAERGAARTLDGLGMLVEQAAESFHVWRGVRPDTLPVIEALRGPV